ncbi:MAG TPA: M23 family metallopeptidase [Kofleriaceae bacterium]
MRLWPWIVGGGIAAYEWSRHRERTPNASLTEPLPGRWVWPLPRWSGRAPAISDGFRMRANGVHHNGLDLMYARVTGDTLRAGSPNGSAHFVMPDNTHAVAASDGVVWSAMKTPRGFAVVIDHGSAKVATFYQHLEKLLVAPTANAKSGEHVLAGQPIGIIGADPLDGEHLKHLHFELWLGGPSQAVDPAPVMRAWNIVDEPSVLVARNASPTYRAIGASGEPYPDWIRALKGKAGVYVIRERDSREIVYVGSSAGSLYGTLTRHFQTWRRSKQFWRGMRGEGHDPGLTYARDSVEVAVRTTSPSASLDEEMRLIARLRPRDNLIGQREPAADEVPF